MNYYGGIDLHFDNVYIAIINEENKTVYEKRLSNRLDEILEVLSAYQNELAGLVVESTYNWYWLVDGLQAAGYKVHLANTCAIKVYEGMKHTNDKKDAYWLAHMLRLGLLQNLLLPPPHLKLAPPLVNDRIFAHK